MQTSINITDGEIDDDDSLFEYGWQIHYARLPQIALLRDWFNKGWIEVTELP